MRRGAAISGCGAGGKFGFGPAGRAHLAAILLLLLAWAGSLSWLVSFSADPQKLVQVRNALFARVAPKSEFLWTPENAPRSFQQEGGRSPAAFSEVVNELLGKGGAHLKEWDKALRLARHLRDGTKVKGRAIQTDTVSAYLAIRRTGGGYCSDYSQVLNGLAYAAGIAVREWGMSFGDFSGDGHAFNEIYDAARGKWMFLDSFFSFYVLDANTGIPLSVLELAETLRGGSGRERVRVEFIDEEAFSFPDRDAALNYYRRGADRLFLGLANNVLEYDRHPVVRWAAKFGRTAEQVAAMVCGMAPRLLIVKTDTNGDAIWALRLTAAGFFLSLLVFLSTTAGLGLVGVRALRRQGVRGGPSSRGGARGW